MPLAFLASSSPSAWRFFSIPLVVLSRPCKKNATSIPPAFAFLEILYVEDGLLVTFYCSCCCSLLLLIAAVVSVVAVGIAVAVVVVVAAVVSVVLLLMS